MDVLYSFLRWLVRCGHKEEAEERLGKTKFIMFTGTGGTSHRANGKETRVMGAKVYVVTFIVVLAGKAG